MSNPETSSTAPNSSKTSITENDLATLSAETGLDIPELSQEVIFGKYKGTVAEMLIDPACPVGGVVRNAYKEGGGSEGTGRQNVIDKITTFSLLDSAFKVEFSPESDVKKNQPISEKQIYPPKPNL